MDIRKAIITAAGRSQATLPLQSLVDRDGVPKTALRILLEDLAGAGVTETAVIIRPGDEPAYRLAAGEFAPILRFFEQPEPRGYGDAVLRARTFTGDDPFLLLVSDHLYVTHAATGCAAQLAAIAAAENCSVSAVQATRENKLPYFGVVGGRRVAGRDRLYEVTEVLEKPTPTEAEQKLFVPGLRAGHYLCFFGMHALTPAVMALLEEESGSAPASAKIGLSPALLRLAHRERYLACELDGHRYDIGAKYGLFTAQLALALEGREREEVLSGLVELLASQRR